MRQTVKGVQGEAYTFALYPLYQSLICLPLVQKCLLVIFKMQLARLTPTCRITISLETLLFK